MYNKNTIISRARGTSALSPSSVFFLSFFVSLFTQTQPSTSLLPSFPPSRFPLPPPPPKKKKKKTEKKTDTCKSPNLESVDTRRVADTLHSSQVPVGKSTRTGSASVNSALAKRTALSPKRLCTHPPGRAYSTHISGSKNCVFCVRGRVYERAFY